MPQTWHCVAPIVYIPRTCGPGELAPDIDDSVSVPLPVGGTVPATLSLTLGAPASFGAFTPGVAQDYTASTTANVISTALDATLTVSDPGHLMNGAFALPEPLEVSLWKRPGRRRCPTTRSRSRSSSGQGEGRAAHRVVLEDADVHVSTTNP